jgi:prepilin-type N-terminal cleavage/methylation domain-containing protein
MTNFLKPKMKGFTLAEVLVSIFVFAVLSLALSRFVVSSYKIHGYSQEQAKAVDEARRGVDKMIQEIRGAGFGDNGAYFIERADDKQLVFFNDIDGDGDSERVRYFLGTVSAGSAVQTCTASSQGGSCSVTFSNFLIGELKDAQVRVYVDGDLDRDNEYVAVTADGATLDDDLCETGCLHCTNTTTWQGGTIFDVTAQAADGSITFLADATNNVGRECPPLPATSNYAMKARFEFSWSQEIIGAGNELKKGIVQPVGDPPSYPSDQEVESFLTKYVRNEPPVFKYYNASGTEIADPLSRLSETSMIRVMLVINIDPNRPPVEYQLDSYVRLRNNENE